MKQILIIEDDEGIQKVLSMLLETFRCEFFQATTIKEARQIFEEKKDSLTHIYVDGCVPGNKLNTLDLVKEMRPKFKGKMYAISSNPEFNDILIEAGCDGGMEKIHIHHHVQKH